LALAASLICFMGWVFLCPHKPWARVRFTEAGFSNDGSLKIVYQCTVSSGAFARLTGFENARKTLDGGTGGRSRIGWPISGSGKLSLMLALTNIAGRPSLLVETGKTYNLEPDGQLPLYNFTNKSGRTYQGRFSLE
jgi:hypothetical protein